jgi:hypothetical protein
MRSKRSSIPPRTLVDALEPFDDLGKTRPHLAKELLHCPAVDFTLRIDVVTPLQSIDDKAISGHARPD